MDLTEVEPAPFGRRFGALLIDWALCLLVAAFYANPTKVGWPSSALRARRSSGENASIAGRMRDSARP